MPKFRKMPDMVEAFQFTGENQEEIALFTNFNVKDFDNNQGIIVRTPSKDIRVEVNDWIIKGVDGEFYLCDPDIFKATYEPI